MQASKISYFNTDINSYPNSVRETYLIIRERAKGNTSFTGHWSLGSMIVVQNFSEIRFNDVLMTSYDLISLHVTSSLFKKALDHQRRWPDSPSSPSW